ncbi:hypothetical protein [Aerosakkonema funiforme]|uniref:Uncharacterized protein n=1 Tax=Aerosakkonema funiforme FACHB-1375 TaxID=2949571 RepID=A0A926VB85_9CYAN|nr:hypothetical protein [Aerosakkonema funiforme]MBD2180632.1 hypothetical protein [Aerosakkonema funiforme FACHB-1375]
MSKLRFALIGASVAALFATPINSSVEKLLCETKTPLCYGWRSPDKILNETQKAAVIGLGLGIAIAGNNENKSKTQLLNLTPDEVATLCLAVLCLILANSSKYKETTEKVASDVRANLAKGKASPSLSYLFKDLKSPGVLAIGAAEGNLTIDGRKTSNYFGHTDPGNSAHNRGFCSWQAGPVSSVQEADIKCLNRIRSRIGHVSSLFEDAGLDVSKHKSAAVAALDLWNQANPCVYQRFPSAYAAALKQGRSGQQARVHARVEAFRKNGVLSANGLFKICRTSKFYIDRFPYAVGSEQWRYNCIKFDQLRRQKQIERVLSIN